MKPSPEDVERIFSVAQRWGSMEAQQSIRRDLTLAKFALYRWGAGGFLCGAGFVLIYQQFT